MAAELNATTLVLGGSGFLGAHVVRQVLRARAPTEDSESARSRSSRRLDGSETDSLVLSASRAPGAVPLPRGARACALDVLRDGDLERLLERELPRAVVLCTALSKIAECEAYPKLADTLNVELPRRVARWCADHRARLVFVSTDLVFGGGAPRPSGYREDDPVAPISEYGRTKARGEAALLDTCPTALVVRLPLLFGPSGGRGLGASDSLLSAIARGERPQLFTDEWRTPLSVVEAAAAIAELLDANHPGRLHVAGPERIDRYDLGLCVLQASGCSAEEARARMGATTRVDTALASTRPADTCLDAARARAFLRTPLSSVRTADRKVLFDEG